jgi:hypothetical protein
MRVSVLPIVLAVPLVCACVALPASARQATPAQAVLAKAACTRIDRLREGQVQFRACVDNLLNAIASEDRASRYGVAWRDCDAAGLKRGTAQFSVCVLDHRDAAGSKGAAPLDASYVKPSDSDSRSYFSAPFDLRRRRETYSCAITGLAPGTGAFADCVANLDSALFNSSVPNG